MPHIDFLHIDIMDGNFVEDLTIGPKYVNDLYNLLPNYYYECHLMVNDPIKYIKNLSFVHRILFHIEHDIDIENTIHLLHSKGIQAGIVINPDTPVYTLDKYIHLLKDDDIVQIMTVYPGKCGQPFLEMQLEIRIDLILHATENENKVLEE